MTSPGSAAAGGVNGGACLEVAPSAASSIASGSSGGQAPGIKFWLQIGLVRESVILDILTVTMENLKEVAAAFVDRKFPDYGFYGQLEKVLLFRHAPDTQNILQLIKNPSEILEGNLVEIVVSESTTWEELEIRPHVLHVHSYKSPHFCDFCGEMLWGLVRQGLKCEGCGLDYHKRCAYKIPNNCSRERANTSSRRASVTSLNSRVPPHHVARSSSATELGEGMATINDNMDTLSIASTVTTGSSTAGLIPSGRSSSSRKYQGRPIEIDKEYAGRIKVPHTFVVHNYALPCICQHCRRLLKGIFRQGVQCKDCKFNCHKRCMPYVARDCLGQPPVVDSLDMVEEDVLPEAAAADDEEDGPTTPQPKPPISPSASNIPLMRIVQSVKNTKRTGSKYFREGWMVHYTSSDDQRKRHYWRLDAKTITMYIDEKSTRYYKEILLGDIRSVDKRASSSAESAGDAALDRPYVFEIKTERMTFFVGEDATSGSGEAGVINSTESGVGLDKAISWENTIRQALMPVTHMTDQQLANVTGATAAVPPPKEPSASTAISKVTAGPPPGGATNGASGSAPGKQDDISQHYHINPDDVLGSGQFGIVYGGRHRQTSTEVAIKVIDKLRFPAEKKEVLKNEVAILQNLNHPAVVNLKQMFETPERIFVIMEKLSGDMLEMILSSPKGRLSERVTKFLIAQILCALKYLHLQNIVHCDLKPENVLLAAENCLFSQIKLCDFGFARIIGDKSFRRSIVGTPAYLAPEVLKSKQGYNRSLDMWSVGVIVYVSLSGTFPFNEDEDISDQIQNATFMYPPNPWKEISGNAIAIINNLLQVKMRKRFTVNRALAHVWLQDYRTWCDLKKLEQAVGQRYLTHESDDGRWEEFRVAHGHQQWEKLGHVEPSGGTRPEDSERYTYQHVEGTS